MNKILKSIILFNIFLIIEINLYSNIYKKLKKDYLENKIPKISDPKIHKIDFKDNNEKLLDLTDKKYKNKINSINKRFLNNSTIYLGVFF